MTCTPDWVFAILMALLVCAVGLVAAVALGRVALKMTVGQLIDGWLVSLPSDSWIVRLRVGRWVLRQLIVLRSERRVCPRCTGNPKTVLEPRRRYFGRCPKCNSLWS